MQDPGETAAKDSSTEDDEKKKKTRHRIRVALDIFSVLAWPYAILKIFVFDVDQFIVDRFLPAAEPIVTFRFFVFLACAVAVALLFKRFYWGLLYVLFFPLIVLFWKLPRAIHKTRSWMVLFGVANVIAAFFTDIRRNFITKSVGIFAVFIVLVADSGAVLSVGVAALFLFLIYTIYRSIRVAFRPSRFIETQERAIQAITGAEPIEKMFKVNDELRANEIQTFDKQQLNTFTASLSFTVIAQQGIVFWAHKLDTYRKSGSSLLFNAAAYLWLFVQVTFTLAFLNLGIHKLDDAAFRSDSASFLSFLNYSLMSLYGGESSSLEPVSQWALIIKVLAGFIGPTIVLTLVVALYLTHRQGSEDAATKEAVRRIHASANRFEEILMKEYSVSVPEAIRRLDRLGSSIFHQVITFLSGQIPDDFDDSVGRSAR